MSALKPGARVRLPKALGGAEGKVEGFNDAVTDVRVDGVGRIRVPTEALTPVAPLPWEYVDEDGDRIRVEEHADDPGANGRVMISTQPRREATTTRVYVPLAELLDVLTRASGGSA